MKTFMKTYLPEEINYNGEIYKLNIDLSNLYNKSHTPTDTVKTALRIQNKKGVRVLVLSANLNGKTDLFSNPYKANKWIFTN